MNKHLQNILDLIQQNENLDEHQKNEVLQSLKDADKELEITAFKLDRTEKVKRTTAILLEETIEELDQKRKAVEMQKRDLEIESSLERVRTVAMGMRKPDDMLEVCRIISEQSEYLGIKEIRNVQTAIIYEAKGTYLNYEYYAKHNKLLVTEVDYRNHERQKLFANQMLRGAEELFATAFAGKELKDWYEYQKTTNQFADSFLEKAETLNYYFYSLGPVALGMSTYIPLNEHEIILFKRFRNVFDLAYRRFLDIEQAEAQAREAQIEAALERIRSRALAMHKSSEVGDVSDLLFSELEKMDINPTGFSIMVFDREQDKYELWRAKEVAHQGVYETFSIKAMYDKLDQYIPGFTVELESRWNSGSQFFIAELSGKKRISFLEANREMGNYTEDQFENVLKIYPDPIFWHLIFFKHGWLGLIQNEQLPADVLQIIRRFADVFEFAHTRFLDLQKAEAQVREAKIEAALERVRSSSLAMSRSEDLKEVVAAIFQKFKELEFGIDKGAALIMTFSPESKDHTQWITDADQTYPVPFFIPFTEHSIALDQINARENGLDFYSKFYDQTGKNEYFEYLFQHTEYKRIPISVQELILNSPNFGISIAFENNSAIAIPSTVGKLVSGDDINILKRFSRVFEQSYTRFLDIQKAELQAREAQIQLALERVRARTMAMQHSNELGEVSFILNKQIVDLGIPTRGCAFNIYGENESTEWFSNLDGTLPTYKTPRKNIFLKYYEAGQRGETLLIEEFGGERIRQHYKYLISLQMLGNAEEEEQILKVMPERQIDHVAYFKFGYLLFITLVPAPEAHEIFKRFAKEFEQTYTRFLDLQKAEAQAREAQIETALERVRSRSMGMQKSEELREVIQVIYDQFIQLGFKIDGAGFALDYMESDDFNFWVATSTSAFPNKVHTPYFDHPQFNRYKEAKEKGLDFYTSSLTFEEKNKFIDHVLKGLPLFPQELKEAFYNAPGYMTSHVVLKNVMLYILNLTCMPFTEIENATLMRFGKVFEQTYTRFNDLQKAEAQVREAQIEASLERVRSRSLAMFSSADMSAVVYEMFTELVKLDAQLDRCLILIVNPQTLGITWYLTGKEGLLSNNGFLVHDNPHHSHQAYLEGWRTRRKKWHYLLAGEEKKSWDAYGFTQTGLSQLPEFIKADMSAVEAIHLTISSDEFGCLIASSLSHLSEAHADIVDRFTRVFNQTYTRFLDLQKAEFQAKEAIKASSLDRVRAEIASMRTVDDLQRITPLIWRELNTLGVPFVRCGVFIMNEANEHVKAHLSAPDGHSLAALDLPFHFNELFKQVVEHWRQGNIFETHWNKQEFLSFMHSMIQHGQVLDKETFQGASAPPESLCLHFVPFKQGMLYVGNITPLELEELQLVKSLAESFSIAYARYDDFRQLEEAKNQIEKTFTELKSTQAQLIQSEKMASLGQLIAGIAHEINTPLGAINASISTITDSSQQSIKLLPALVKVLSDDDLKLFMELVNRSAISNNSLSSKEEREFRRKITSKLEESGIAEADDFADILVDMGIYDEIESYLPLYKPQTMQTAYHLSMQIKNSKNIKMAVERASKVVFALKNYARYGNEQSMVEANIVDGLETVLTLYQNQLKHGITLHKEFEEVSPILCYPDELNQVWTNLIHNAIQAMEGKGELSVSVSKNPTTANNLTVSSDLSVFENQDRKNPKGFTSTGSVSDLWGLEVRITDTGKGIPHELKDRIFDAFFTTKPAGEGSGLGLYIVKQIIDKHKGKIWFESLERKGSTVFVELPLLK